MPNNLIKDIHNQTGKSIKKLEHEYKKEENIAKKKGITNPYAYATEIVDRISGYKPKNK